MWVAKNFLGGSLNRSDDIEKLFLSPHIQGSSYQHIIMTPPVFLKRLPEMPLHDFVPTKKKHQLFREFDLGLDFEDFV